MYSLPLEFKRRLQDGFFPEAVLALENAAGLRLYGTRQPEPDAFGWTEVHLADSSHRADGSVRAGEGSLSIVARRAALSWVRLSETLTPERSDLLGSLRGQEAGRLAAVLNNDPDGDGPRHFSRILMAENILGASVRLRLVFPDLSGPEETLDRFRGRVLAFSLTREKLTLEVGAL